MPWKERLCVRCISNYNFGAVEVPSMPQKRPSCVCAIPPPCYPLLAAQAFYESQQATTRGFMRMAVSTLAMLNTLVRLACIEHWNSYCVQGPVGHMQLLAVT